jgi:hypothetical protein
MSLATNADLTAYAVRRHRAVGSPDPTSAVARQDQFAFEAQIRIRCGGPFTTPPGRAFVRYEDRCCYRDVAGFFQAPVSAGGTAWDAGMQVEGAARSGGSHAA